MTRLDRNQLIQLVTRIRSTSGCVVDLDALLGQLEANVRQKDVARLIFDPPDGKDLSAEEIVDRALAE